MTVKVFRDWILENFDVEVCIETARLYLYRLDFNILDHQKGVFFDGHDCEDVVQYRMNLLTQLDILDKKTDSWHSPTCFTRRREGNDPSSP